MSKQDRQGVRTAADLERKYNFGEVFGDGAESYAKVTEQLNRLNQTMAQFMANTIGAIEELERDSATWFYSGVPSLKNQPAVEWTTDELKDKHIGDMYYDEVNSRTYLFRKVETEVDGEKTVEYGWTAMFVEYLPDDIVVTFYDENEKVLAVYSVKEGMAVNPPAYEATWKDGDGNVIEFPYVPTENIDLYAVVSADG